MSGAHTPEPWSKHRKNNGWRIVRELFVGEREPLVIATVHQRGARFDANARLIASAPDLLKACAATLAGYPGWQNMVADAYEKATGEKP